MHFHQNLGWNRLVLPFFLGDLRWNDPTSILVKFTDINNSAKSYFKLNAISCISSIGVWLHSIQKLDSHIKSCGKKSRRDLS